MVRSQRRGVAMVAGSFPVVPPTFALLVNLHTKHSIRLDGGWPTVRAALATLRPAKERRGCSRCLAPGPKRESRRIRGSARGAGHGVLRWRIPPVSVRQYVTLYPVLHGLGGRRRGDGRTCLRTLPGTLVTRAHSRAGGPGGAIESGDARRGRLSWRGPRVHRDVLHVRSERVAMNGRHRGHGRRLRRMDSSAAPSRLPAAEGSSPAIRRHASVG